MLIHTFISMQPNFQLHKSLFHDHVFAMLPKKKLGINKIVFLTHLQHSGQSRAEWSHTFKLHCFEQHKHNLKKSGLK